jgi:hypothetical protein
MGVHLVATARAFPEAAVGERLSMGMRQGEPLTLHWGK